MKSLKPECHQLAEHILYFPAKTEEMRWLKAQITELLLKDDNIGELSYDFAAEQEIQNPYLAELTRTYEEASN